MEKSICKECKNYMFWYQVGNINMFGGNCIFDKGVNTAFISKCTHFKAKPKDNKELKEQAKKALDKKGQTIETAMPNY